MRSKVLLVSALMLSLAACKKDENTTTEETTETKAVVMNHCMPAQSNEKDKDGKFKDKDKFTYDANHKLQKIEDLDESGSLNGYEELEYDADGKVTKVVSKDASGTATGEMIEYTYSGSSITKVKTTEVDSGKTESITYTFTYTGGSVSNVEHDKTDSDFPNFGNIEWTDGNITKTRLFFKIEEQGIPLTAILDIRAEFDDKPNIKAFDINEGDNFFVIGNRNNLKYVIALSDLPAFKVAKGDTIIHRKYTYEGDRVSKVEDLPGAFNDGDASTTEYTGTCAEFAK